MMQGSPMRRHRQVARRHEVEAHHSSLELTLRNPFFDVVSYYKIKAVQGAHLGGPWSVVVTRR
jgi:hypothetical protein